jgi:glycosyltransferase involved in cell wall biosynthesis
MTHGSGERADVARLISVVMPCFNEEATVEAQVQRVLATRALGLNLEIVVVDDGSVDGSAEILDRLAQGVGSLRLVRHKRNIGKGAALRSGIRAATGEVILLQDADLEYNPAEYPKLLGPILREIADVVYGSRFRGGDEVRVLYFWHSIANRVLTLISNMFTDLNLTDMESGFKAFRRSVLDGIELQEERFGFEAEVTAKLARLRPRPRIFEVGVSYHGRTYAEGKKIGLRDAFRALYCIVRYSLW